MLVFSRFFFCLLSNFRLFLDSHDTAQENSFYSKVVLLALTLTWPHEARDILSYNSTGLQRYQASVLLPGFTTNKTNEIRGFLKSC